MKQYGNTRVVDNMGRVLLPKEWREMLNWDTGTLVTLEMKNGIISISHYPLECVLCHEEIPIDEYVQHLSKGKWQERAFNHSVCASCIAKLTITLTVEAAQ